MNIKELKALIKKLPNDMEVFECSITGKCSKQGIHEYNHIIEKAKYKKVPCDGYVSDGFGGKYKPLNNFTWVMTKPKKVEKRKGLFLDLLSYSGD